MDFAIVGAFLPTDELVPIARAADELGYAGFAIADHVVDLETIETPYPNEADGSGDRACRTPARWLSLSKPRRWSSHRNHPVVEPVETRVIEPIETTRWLSLSKPPGDRANRNHPVVEPVETPDDRADRNPPGG